MKGTITCVECGGTAHRMTPEPPAGFAAGQIIVYACEDCSHRLDVVQDAPTGLPPDE